MAAADTARLITELSLNDKLTAGLTKASSAVGKLGVRTTALGVGLGVGLERLAEKGISSVIGAVRGGIDSLTQLESAVSSVQGALDQMGLAGQITGQQVATWANQIEDSVGAAFDDKEITQAAATLIRFGKITSTNLQPALVVMTDLATKTGSVDGAAQLLAKALADPAKAAGKLARSGVVLTKQQQEQIKVMVAAGKTAEAQAFLLDELAKATTGAARASQGPAKQAAALLADAFEDTQRALAEGLLPTITETRAKLTTFLKDPATINRIRDFGKALAGGFRAVLDFASKIPWSTIGNALSIAGAGAKLILDAFTSMPPWVQTAVITGWGLNKLTGGALSGLVGELGKGLIKGVLGMNAGVVNINAAVVKGAGGVPGTVAKLGGVAGALASVGGIAGLTTILAIAAPLVAVAAFAAWAGLDKFPNGQQNRPGGFLGVDPTKQSPKDKRTAEEFAAATKELDKAARALQKPLPSSGDPRLRPGALDANIYKMLDDLIGKAGGKFLRTGEKAKTLDENAGKLVELFRASTNPSLESMQDNMAILKGLADRGDTKTRAQLSDDIAALQALIDAKLTEINKTTAALRADTTGDAGYMDQRGGEIGRDVTPPITKSDIRDAFAQSTAGIAAALSGGLSPDERDAARQATTATERVRAAVEHTRVGLVAALSQVRTVFERGQPMSPDERDAASHQAAATDRVQVAVERNRIAVEQTRASLGTALAQVQAATERGQAMSPDERDAARRQSAASDRIYESVERNRVGLERQRTSLVSSLSQVRAAFERGQPMSPDERDAARRQTSATDRVYAAVERNRTSLSARLLAVEAAVNRLRGLTTGNTGYMTQRSGEIGRPDPTVVVVKPAILPSARDFVAATQTFSNYGPVRPRGS